MVWDGQWVKIRLSAGATILGWFLEKLSVVWVINSRYMKNYININIIILSLIATNIAAAEEITLPVISDEIMEFSKEAAISKSAARSAAYGSSKPLISEALERNVKAMVDLSIRQQLQQNTTIQQLLNKTINNKDWKNNQSKYIQAFNKELDLGEQTTQTTQGGQVSGHRIYLFISSSIPTKNMRQYAKELTKYPNAQIVMRGFIGGANKMQPTMAYIKSIIAKDESCMSINCKNYNTKINIDPVLFNRYGITKVPTLIYVDELSGANYCSEGNTDIVKANGVHRFTGLAPLSYMIRELAETTKLVKLEQLYLNSYESNN